MMTLSPNILITNYCNQNCPFCFASREMSSPTLSKEMSIASYKKTLTKLRHSGYKGGIKLLGGEPTLHSQLFEMLDLAVQNNHHVQIFTNGVISNEKIAKLTSYTTGIGYTFNVMTPGFQLNPKLRQVVSSNMKTLGAASKLTLSITLDPFFNSDSFFKGLSDDLWKVVAGIRIGLSNPIAGSKNWYTFGQFPKIGTVMVDFMKKAGDLGFRGHYTMNCGFTRCMFTEQEYSYLVLQLDDIGWSCFGKKSSMDIAVDLTAFHCFPLSNHKRVDLKKVNYKKADHELMKERMRLWAKLKMKVCVKCPFYGYGGDKCPGPCLAFRMNL